MQFTVVKDRLLQQYHSLAVHWVRLGTEVTQLISGATLHYNQCFQFEVSDQSLSLVACQAKVWADHKPLI
jgi:hypothetical protein